MDKKSNKNLKGRSKLALSIGVQIRCWTKVNLVLDGNEEIRPRGLRTETVIHPAAPKRVRRGRFLRGDKKIKVN